VSEANTALGVTVVDEVVVKVCSDGTAWRPLPHRIPSSAILHHRHRGERVAEWRDVIRWSHRTTGPRNNAPRSRPRSKRAAHDPIIVKGGTFYMVSRPGGYNVLGASSEERRESGARVGEVQRLLRDALDVVPALETAVVLETREGNRPASDDLRPFFEVLGDGRWAWSSGHFRHGVTLAPIAAGEVLRFAEGVA